MKIIKIIDLSHGSLQGLFGIPELKEASGFYELKKHVESETQRLVAEAVSPNRERKLVQVFDQLSDTLCRLADMVSRPLLRKLNAIFPLI